MAEFTIRLLDSHEEMISVEELQRAIWPGSETDVVPAHLLITAVHNGGIVSGAYVENKIVGFVFGFPGLEMLPDGPHPKHCSHMMGVHPDYRNLGVGFALKRAQWQLVRKQGIGHITWTYDPLLSMNAYLNIARLGAVCNTYRRSEYGEMRDGLNAGLPSDRFQLDWWVNTQRVKHRLSKNTRGSLKLAQYAKADLNPQYSLIHGDQGLMQPPETFPTFTSPLILAEIPPDFMAIKQTDIALARDWRFFSREFFETAFETGYIVTDFIFDRTSGEPRSLYVLTDGEATLENQT